MPAKLRPQKPGSGQGAPFPRLARVGRRRERWNREVRQQRRQSRSGKPA